MNQSFKCIFSCFDSIDRYFSYFFKGSTNSYDNDNVNVILTGDQLYSITESGGMTLLDKDTLQRQERVGRGELPTFQGVLMYSCSVRLSSILTSGIEISMCTLYSCRWVMSSQSM